MVQSTRYGGRCTVPETSYPGGWMTRSTAQLYGSGRLLACDPQPNTPTFPTLLLFSCTLVTPCRCILGTYFVMHFYKNNPCWHLHGGNLNRDIHYRLDRVSPCFCLLNGEGVYYQISWTLANPTDGLIVNLSLQLFANWPIAKMPKLLSDFGATISASHPVSPLRNFTRSNSETGWFLVNRRPWNESYVVGSYCSLNWQLCETCSHWDTIRLSHLYRLFT